MNTVTTLKNNLANYEVHLKEAELAERTIKKYLRDVRQFLEWADSEYYETVTKAMTIKFKDHLINNLELKTSTVNSKIISLNKYLTYLDLEEATLNVLKVQADDLENAMSQSDYDRILRMARRRGTVRDVLMLETLSRTGLRVSELEFFTVESVKQGYMRVVNKGKERKVPISKTLEKLARAYIKEHKIKAGSIINNRQGEPLGRNYIYKRMQYLAGQARVNKKRAHPHNIRHLFAINWLERNGQRITQLADILGHESLETTRIYTKLTVDKARLTMD